jgi:hypothetical protein
VIVTCVRWYLRFCLSLRDVEELMAELGLSVDHTTIWRWVQIYGPEVYQRLSGEVKRKSSTWLLTINRRTFLCETVCTAIQQPYESYRERSNCMAVVGNARDATVITGSNPTTATSSGGCGRCRDRERPRRRGR